jgi:hypothetical protein
MDAESETNLTDWDASTLQPFQIWKDESIDCLKELWTSSQHAKPQNTDPPQQMEELVSHIFSSNKLKKNGEKVQQLSNVTL